MGDEPLPVQQLRSEVLDTAKAIPTALGKEGKPAKDK